MQISADPQSLKISEIGPNLSAGPFISASLTLMKYFVYKGQDFSLGKGSNSVRLDVECLNINSLIVPQILK